MNVFKVFALVGLGLFLMIGVIIFGNAMQASDYEASNNTGENTPYTNQTVGAYSITTAWYSGLVILLFVLIIAYILWMFFVR